MIDPVVDHDWLRVHGHRVVLADVRWYLDGRSGRAAYENGHLPGAVFVDLNRVLAGPASPAAGRHPLPDPETFAAGLAELGIGDGDTVIAYDDAGGSVAARLVWLLRITEHDAALLDGGVTGYDGELERTQPRAAVTSAKGRPMAIFTARPWPADRLADIEEVSGGSGDVLLDARERARFRGEVEPVDPRPGHIPGARSLPHRENVDASQRFLPVPQLRERFAAVGVTEGTPVIAYCGSGVTACHTLLALEHAGLGTGRLYAGSWSQYSGDPNRAAALGD